MKVGGRLAQQRIGGGRAGGGVDRSAEAMPYQVGQVAAMIEVSVGEHDGVEVRGVEVEFEVAGVRLAAGALEQAAIEQQALPVQRQQVARTRDRLGCPMEGKLHRGRLAVGRPLLRARRMAVPWEEKRVSSGAISRCSAGRSVGLARAISQTVSRGRMTSDSTPRAAASARGPSRCPWKGGWVGS